MDNNTLENRTTGNSVNNALCPRPDWSDLQKIFFTMVLSLMFVVGVLGNGLVISVLLWFRKKCNLTEICLLNLALSDLLLALSLVFFARHAAHGHWPWDMGPLVNFPGTTLYVLNYIMITILDFILPLSIMVFCYSRIIPIVIKIKTQRKHKAIKLIFIIIITFFLFWTPYQVVIFLDMLVEQDIIKDCQLINRVQMAIVTVDSIRFCQCCHNPIICAFAGENFCQLVVKMVGQWLPGRPQSRPGTETSNKTRHTPPEPEDFIF